LVVTEYERADAITVVKELIQRADDGRAWSAFHALLRELDDAELRESEAFRAAFGNPCIPNECTLAENIHSLRYVLNQVTRELNDAKTHIDMLRSAARDALHYIENRECHHENTQRGGVIWTICEDCGKKWSDDRNPCRPYVEPTVMTRLRNVVDQSCP
jgi:hypothetical protein